MDEESQQTLLRIEQNDNMLTNLFIGHAKRFYSIIYNNDDDEDGENNNNKGRFMSSFDDNFLRLGEGIRQSTHITKLQVAVSHIDRMEWVEDINSSFHRGLCEGIQQNESINELILRCDGSSIFSVEHPSAAGRRILEVYQTNNNLTDLSILNANLLIGRGGEQIIATTLQCCTNLRTINLYQCSISANMLSPMVEAMRGIHSLENLYLIGNQVQYAGCEVLATLLEDPNCNITTLQLQDNGIGDLGAIAIASSLKNNTKLENLYFDGNDITRIVEDIFCGVLCTTLSISTICSSNHTLADLQLPNRIEHTHLSRLLQVNKGTNKIHVVMKKILQYHPHIDTKPFFGWDMDGEWTLKGLPYVIDWFNRATVAVNDRGKRRAARAKDRVNYNVDQKKLTAIYEFAKAVPSMFVPASHTTVNDNDKKKRKRG